MSPRRDRMRKEMENKTARNFILKLLIFELGIILGLALILWLLKDGTFLECLYKSTWLMSFASILHLGLEIFSSLANNRWRIKPASAFAEKPHCRAFCVLTRQRFWAFCPFPLPRQHVEYSVGPISCKRVRQVSDSQTLTGSCPRQGQ